MSPVSFRVGRLYSSRDDVWTPERYVPRMWLGAPSRWRADMVFGVFNFGVA
jgi:hypothetical protein